MDQNDPWSQLQQKPAQIEVQPSLPSGPVPRIGRGSALVKITAIVAIVGGVVVLIARCGESDPPEPTYTLQSRQPTLQEPTIASEPDEDELQQMTICENAAYLRFETGGIKAGNYMATVEAIKACLGSFSTASVGRFCARIADGKLHRPCPDGDLWPIERFCKPTREAMKDACQGL